MRASLTILAATTALALAGPACVDAECVSDETFFADEVWGKFMGTQCFACHSAQGVANQSELVLRSQNEPDYLAANFEIVKSVSQYEKDGVSILLLKPTNKIAHDGGAQLKEGDDAYHALEELLRRFEQPTQCAEDDSLGVAKQLVLLDEQATFRKAAIVVGGRLPTAEEDAQLKDGDAADLDAALDGLLEEEGFSRFMKETYNDLFLTDRYASDQRAIDLLDGDLFPNKEWYRQLPSVDVDGSGNGDGEAQARRRATNLAVAREPLELIAYVAKNDLPFTEILTADYFMVNAYSARTYGVTADLHSTSTDEFRPARLEGIPHAGVLTSPMWLNRFPTTDTNRNRHRARMVFKFFLATDVMKLAARPVDSSAIAAFNPTRENPQCTVCHAQIDPVAGALQAWNAQGEYAPPADGWYPEMFAPGYGEEAMPYEQASSGTQWLAARIAKDPLFALATVHDLYRGLTGREPAQPAPSDDPDVRAKNEAYRAQDAAFKDVAAQLVDANYNVKVALKALIKSRYFRADGVKRELNHKEAIIADSFGTGRFLTPELLDRKIEATVGIPWTRSAFEQTRVLLSTNDYLVFYGGIDSDTITERIKEPNGLMAAVATRMANEVACRATARDFAKAPTERVLFPLVEQGFEPLDANGFEVANAKQAVLDNIVYLHERLLGERRSTSDEDIQAAYNLWLTTWQQGRNNLAADVESEQLPGECRADRVLGTGEALPTEQQLTTDPQYTIRAWMAVVSYLLSDFRYLHE